MASTLGAAAPCGDRGRDGGVVLAGAGVLAPAVALYALALLTTASLATALGRAGWFGGALFILSDGLIAARSFAGFDLPQQDVAVMATYIVAHGLLVLGVIRFLRARRSRI